MTKRELIALSVLICATAFAQESKQLTYTEEKALEASKMIKEFQAEMDAFGKTIDETRVREDLKKFGEPDETEVRFKQIQFPLMKAVKPLENLHFKFTVQTGGYTASDLIPAIIDPITDELLGFCIIKRKDTINGVTKETYATLGGFHEYGLTYAQNGAKEALEEAQIEVPISTIKFVGLYDDPKRDPRQHISSLAFTGATFDVPKITAEAREVYVWTADQIRAIPNDQWFGKDHRQIALDAIKTFEANEDEIRAALETAMPRAMVKNIKALPAAAPAIAPAPQAVAAQQAAKNRRQGRTCNTRGCQRRANRRR